MGLIYKTCADGDFDEAYNCDPCFDAENGNVRSLVLIRKGTAIAFPLVKFDWELQVGLGNIFIMPETRGSFDGGTPKYITGYGSTKEKKVGDDYILSVSDPNYVDNVLFYQEAEKHLWNIAYLSETQLNYVAQDVTLTAKAPIEEDLETDVAWDLELKWFSKLKPVTTAYLPIASLFVNDGSGFDYEVITGLSLADGSVTPQVVFLAVDADKICYVVLPNGTILTSIEGTIDTTWTGAAGAVTLIKSKDTSVLDMTNSDYIGNLITTQSGSLQTVDCASLTSISAPNATSIDAYGCTSLTSLSAQNAIYIEASGCTSLTSLSAPNATTIEASYCTSLTSLSAPNATSIAALGCTSLTSLSAQNAIYIDASGCTSLTSLSAQNATYINASGCALTAVAIAALLAELYTAGNLNGILDISGGTNSDITSWYDGDTEVQFDDLILNGWTITYNGEL